MVLITKNTSLTLISEFKSDPLITILYRQSTLLAMNKMILGIKNGIFLNEGNILYSLN